MSSIRQRLLILLLGLWTTVWLAVALITLDRKQRERVAPAAVARYPAEMLAEMM